MTTATKKSKSPTKTAKHIHHCATGRRKTAIARVFLKEGKGNIAINNVTVEKYFPRKTSRMIVHQPLEVLEATAKFDIKITVRGGGKSGQAGAIRLGIARALVKYDEQGKPQEGIELNTEELIAGQAIPLTTRKILRKAKLLTRDSRAVERKKVGHHKARKSIQFSKR